MQTKEHKIINNDNIKELKGWSDGIVDLTITSPPYDAIRDYKGNWVIDFPSLGDELYRVTKDGGVCAVIIGDSSKDHAKTMTSFNLAVDWTSNRGWRLFECCIYSRACRPGAWWNYRFKVEHEYILIFFKGDKPKSFDKKHMMIPNPSAGMTYHFNQRTTSGNIMDEHKSKANPTMCKGTIWRYSASTTEGNKLKMQHPATYPDKLAEDLVLCFSSPGDLVIDPFSGSGTTSVMALKHNRNTISIDASKEYCEIAEKRISNEVSNTIF